MACGGSSGTAAARAVAAGGRGAGRPAGAAGDRRTGGSGGVGGTAAQAGQRRRRRAGRTWRRGWHQRHGRLRGRDRRPRRRRHRRARVRDRPVHAPLPAASARAAVRSCTNGCCACEPPLFDDFNGMACGDGGTGAISYVGCRFIGGINRVVVAKRDTSRNLCVNVVFGQGPAPAGLTLPTSYGLESVSVGTASACPTRSVLVDGGRPGDGHGHMGAQRQPVDGGRRPRGDAAGERRGADRPQRQRHACVPVISANSPG